MNKTGLFFCQNCGHTIVDVTFEQKPEKPCEKCGFGDWIFEPVEDDHPWDGEAG